VSSLIDDICYCFPRAVPGILFLPSRKGTIMNLEFLFSALTSVWGVGEILLAVFTQTRQGEGKIYKIAERRSFSGV
jgi:hypothetical protein